MQEKEKEIYAGIYQEMAEIIGSENMKKLYRKFKGQQIVFPQKLYSKTYVKEYLLMNRGKMSVGQMSRHLGLSDRRIRQLMSEMTKTHR